MVTQFSFANMAIRLVNSWHSASPTLESELSHYPLVRNPSPDLQIGVVSAKGRRPKSPSFTTRYGRMLEASWEFDRSPTVTLRPLLHPGRALRPIFNNAGHGLSRDLATLIHERVFTTFVQLVKANTYSFVHAAMMVSPTEQGVMITGGGGVGKTSLALELGRERGYSFLSDDLVVVQRSGVAFLNASYPKVYAYNAIGDKALEEKLLRNAHPTSKVNWKLKRGWPNRARIHIDPLSLYGSIRASSTIDIVLLLQRDDSPAIRLSEVGPSELSHSMARTLWHELRGHRSDVEHWLLQSEGLSNGLTFEVGVWADTIRSAIQGARLVRVSIPISMDAMAFREQVVSVLTNDGLIV